MLAKMKMRVVSVLMGTAMMVAPVSLGTCELMYTPSEEVTTLTEPLDGPDSEGIDTEFPGEDEGWTDGGNGDGGYYYGGGYWFGGYGGMMP